VGSWPGRGVDPNVATEKGGVVGIDASGDEEL
jgi:hypothetical protein